MINPELIVNADSALSAFFNLSDRDRKILATALDYLDRSQFDDMTDSEWDTLNAYISETTYNALHEVNTTMAAENVRVYTTSSIVIPNSLIYTPVSFSGLRYQSSGFWQLSEPTKFIVPASKVGLYDIFGHVNWNGVSGGTRELYIRVNGGSYIAATTDTQDTDFETPQSISTQYYLYANDYVEMCVRVIGAGSARSLVTAGNYGQEFGMAKVG